MILQGTAAPPMSAEQLEALMFSPFTTVISDQGSWFERYKWCRDNLEQGTWNFIPGRWYFARSQDAALFALRWL
jgi:hypothetical protein